MKTRRVQVKAKAVEVVVPAKEEVQSVIEKLILSSGIPEQLGSTLEAWKLLGNKWLSCMEANLELHTLGKKIAGNEKGEIELNGIRALIFMGYMAERKGGLAEGWLVTYRLTEKGKKAVNMTEPSVPEKRTAKPKTTQLALTDTLVECPDCQGAGVLDNGDLCAECMGTGETNPYQAAVKTIAPNAKTSATLNVKPKADGATIARRRIASRRR